MRSLLIGLALLVACSERTGTESEAEAESESESEAEAESESESEAESEGECDGTCQVPDDCTRCPGDCPSSVCGSSCGDGTCTTAECETCPADCKYFKVCFGSCVCGDGTCDDWDCGEGCGWCPDDCGDCCGDGYCDSYGKWEVENCLNCTDDCGTCEFSDGCSVSEDPTCGDCVCEAEVCEVLPECCDYYWHEGCVLACFDLGECETTCGDALCTGDENACTCPDDCFGFCPACGDDDCSFAYGEGCASCPEDCGTCGTCGDGSCTPSAGENCLWCADCAPCGVCGDGLCNPASSGYEEGEYCNTCPEDCGACVCPASEMCETAAIALCTCCFSDPTCFGSVCDLATYLPDYLGCDTVLGMTCDEMMDAGYCYSEGDI